MNTEKLVMAALKEKAPALLQQLTQSGELRQFVMDQAEEITDQIGTLGMQIASKRGCFKPPFPDPMTKVGIMNMANSMATEIVLHEMLQFPQDETSPSSQDETTVSETAT